MLGCHEPPPSQSGMSKPIPLNPALSACFAVNSHIQQANHAIKRSFYQLP